MPNGEIQLVAKAAQDLYLTNNPSISFYKTVYKKYTNFSMELIKLDPEHSNFLNENSEVVCMPKS